MIKLSSPATDEFWEIPVLYEDADLLALNKPPGLSTTPDRTDPSRPSLMGLMHKAIADSKPWAATRGLSFLMYSHRLDPEAGGVLLLAKNKSVLIQLLDLFGSERTRLSFLTLLQGTPAEDHFSVEAKISPHATRPGVMRIDRRHGKRASTTFEVIERFKNWTLIKCLLSTHRPHQIRVHLARSGLRVAGDTTYGGRPLLLSSLKPGYHLKPKHTERPLLGHACLHAAELTLNHPVTGASLTVKAPWPKDLLVALKYLRKYDVVQGGR